MDHPEAPLDAALQYFANAVGAVHFVPAAYVHLHWHGVPMTSVELRALYAHTRNLLRRNNLRRILADHRAMPIISPDDKEWLLTEWIPETVALTGYSHCAVLRGPDPATRLHTDAVISDLRRHVTVEVFEELREAADWLKSV